MKTCVLRAGICLGKRFPPAVQAGRPKICRLGREPGKRQALFSPGIVRESGNLLARLWKSALKGGARQRESAAASSAKVRRHQIVVETPGVSLPGEHQLSKGPLEYFPASSDPDWFFLTPTTDRRSAAT